MRGLLRSLAAVVVALVAGAGVARAEITAVWTAGEDRHLVVDVLNRTTFRVGGVIDAPRAGDTTGYALMHEGTLYLAFYDEGQLWSRRWDQAEVPFDRVALLATNGPAPVETDLSPTRLTETVGEYRGSVWEWRRRWADGSVSLREVVATDAPAVVEATAAMARFAEAAAADVALEDGPAIGRLIRLLEGQGLGLLRLGASLRLRETRFDPLPPDAFTLPPDGGDRATSDEGWLGRLEEEVLRGLGEAERTLRGVLDDMLGEGGGS